MVNIADLPRLELPRHQENPVNLIPPAGPAVQKVGFAFRLFMLGLGGLLALMCQTEHARADPARALQAATALQRGDYAAAAQLYAEEVREQDRALGEQHPTSLAMRAGLIQALRGQGRLDEALAQSETLLRVRTALHGERHVETLSAMGHVADVLGGLGRLREELALNEKFHRLSQDLAGERHPVTQKAMASLAASLRVMGRGAEALPLAEKVHGLRRELHGERHPLTLASMNEVAQCLGAVGRNAEQIAVAESLHTLQRQLHGERHPVTLLALGNLAVAYQAAGRLSEALSLSERVLAVRLEVLGRRHHGSLVAMNNVARAYESLSRHGEAMAMDEQYMAGLLDVHGERHPQTMWAMGNLARQYTAVGRFEQALTLSEKSHKLLVEAQGERSLSALSALNNLSIAYSDSGRTSEAAFLAERLVKLRIELSGERDPGTLVAQSVLAHAYRLSGRTGDAHALYERLLAVNTELRGPRHVDTLNAMNNLALTHAESGRHAQALALLEPLVPMATEVLGEHDPRTLKAIGSLAAGYADLKRPADAAALSKRYVEGAEWHRSRAGLSPETRQSLFGSFVPMYRYFANLKGQMGETAESFRLSELTKARTLLESMAIRRAGHHGGLPALERERLDSLDTQIQATTSQLAQASGADVRQRLETRRNDLTRQHAALRQALRQQYPKYDQLSEVRLIEAAELAQVVPAGAAAISYLVASDRGVAQVMVHVVASDGRLRWRHLGPIAHLEELVDCVRLAASHPGGLTDMLAAEGRILWRLDGNAGYRLLDRKAPAPNGAVAVRDPLELPRYLSSRLLTPLAPWLSGSSAWIVSPDGVLAQLPFELLPFGPGGEAAIAGVDIHYTQSLSVLAASQAKQRDYQSLADRRPLFAMGNPQYQAVETPAPSHRPRARGLATDAATPLHKLDTLWTNLPGTQREVESVARLFGEQASIHMGAQATEQMLQAMNARGELRNFRYMLFAAHGFLSPSHPSLSSLVLGLVNRAPGTDGYVTAAEWPTYDLRTDLTVLSACDTGIGPVVSGEGVMGLPFALFVAGSVNTVLSLWPVADNATAAFMQALFERLKSGKSPSRALSATKREFMSHPRQAFRAPAVWAPFVLVGAG
jgi:tetratricopeptide (TPR) repeat protein